MDRLSEELLDHIVSYVLAPQINNRPIGHADILCVSKVSRQLHRISQPHLYRAINLKGMSFGETPGQIMKLLGTRPQLRHHIKSVNLHVHYPDAVSELTLWLSQLPNLRTIGLQLNWTQLPDLTPFLKLPGITTLRMSGVQFQNTEFTEDFVMDVINDTITTLDISVADPEDPWENCNDIVVFAQTFTNLQHLSLHSSDEGESRCVLNAPAFRCLVHSFRVALQTTLRKLSYRYNDATHGLDHYGFEDISNRYDARRTLKESQLEHLTIETECLLRPASKGPKSLRINPSCLPATLRTLYLRHHVSHDRLESDRENLMYSEEAQYLAQILSIVGHKSRFPNMIKVTLAVFLPIRFGEVASRVMKKHTRHVQVPLDVVFVPLEDYDSEDTLRSWPQYTASQDPRLPTYDPASLQQPRD